MTKAVINRATPEAMRASRNFGIVVNLVVRLYPQARGAGARGDFGRHSLRLSMETYQ
jgi:hypothetical protein